MSTRADNFLGKLIVRRRGWIALAWLAAFALLLPMARRVESVLSVAARVAGSESAEVEAQLAARFESPLAHHVLLVVAGLPSPARADGREALRRIVDAVEANPHVTRLASYLDRDEEVFLGAGPSGGTFIVVGLSPTARPDALLGPLRATTRELAGRLRSQYPDITLDWTGEIALNADLRMASAADAQTAERRALPVILLLLVLTFGSLVAAFLPLITGLLAIGVTLGFSALVATHWSLSVLLQNVVTMIGLGLGIDYSLLIVSRYREELYFGRSETAAAEEALRHAGPTILLSGASVAIGFAALATTPVNELRSVAVAGLLVVSVSMLLSTTLLPGLLAAVGRHIDLGRLPLLRRGTHPRWAGWSGFVVKNPWRVLLTCGLPVCLLALPARNLRIELPRGDWLPRQMESAQALRTLQEMRRGAIVQTVRVILDLPAGTSAVSDAGWQATERLARALALDPAVDRVRSLPGLVGSLDGLLPRATILEGIPADVRQVFLSRDSNAAVLEITPREETSPVDLKALVRRLRAFDAPAVTGAPGARLLVGGLAAFNVDYQSAIAGRFRQVVFVIVAATFLVLAIGFRSLLIPLKAIALNLLAVAGAFGAVTLVFQEGIGASLLGLGGPLDGIFAAIPPLVFCTVFGLSMDYEVFLVARVREARQAGRSEHDAIAEGLMRTGSLITSAAAIMVVVFGAFIFGELLLIKMLGFALAVAVLLDATVMRLAVSPALLTLAGRWNWWPGQRDDGTSTK